MPVKDMTNAAQLQLNPAEQAGIASWNAHTFNPAAAEFRVWPIERTPEGLRAAGWCPYCRRPHDHIVGGNPLRVPHCSTALPPFHDTPKPDTYRIVVVDEPAPHDLIFAIEAHRADLLMLAAVALPKLTRTGSMLAIRDAERHARSRSKAVTRETFAAACRAMLDAGIFAERTAIMCENSSADAATISRQLVAQFIRRQDAGPMRLRLARALHRAWALAGRGEAA